MKRRQLVIALAGLSVIVIVTALLVDAPRRAGASSLSYGPSGWLAARRYLQHRNVQTVLVDKPLHELADGNVPTDVLVLTFPSLGAPWPQEREALARHLVRGGTVVFAFSGWRVGASERRVADWLGLEWQPVRDDPPLSPIAWRQFASEEWHLRSAGADGRLEGIKIRAVDSVPKAPSSARVLLYGARDVAFVYLYQRGKGLVVVMPAEILANARIGNVAHANLLETLISMTGDSWGFDEYIHGLTAPSVASAKLPRFAFDLFLLQMGLAYALGVWRLAKSFGPAWRDAPAASGSTRSFLLGLGRLHHRLKHHAAAAPLLIERARELQPNLSLHHDIPAETASDSKGLVSLGRAVAAAQSRTRSHS